MSGKFLLVVALSACVVGLCAASAMADPKSVTLNPTATESFINSNGTGSGWGDVYVAGDAAGRARPNMGVTWNAGLYYGSFSLPTDLAGATGISAILNILPCDSNYQGVVYRVFGDPGTWAPDWGSTTLSTTTPGTVTGATYPNSWGGVPGTIDISTLVQAWAAGQLASGANGLAFTSALEGNAGHQNLSAGSFWIDMTYTPAAATFLPGDADKNGVVDDNDLNALLSAWGTGTTWAEGNFKGTGTTDDNDLNALLSNWGKTSGAAVPEPVTMSLLAIGGLALLRRKH